MKMELNFNEDIKILQLTDLHFRDPMATFNTSDVKEVIEYEKPNYILVTGDVYHWNKPRIETLKQIDALINCIDVYDIPWSLCFGNHELESLVPHRYQMNYIIENAKNFIGHVGKEITTLHDENDFFNKYEKIGNYSVDLFINGKNILNAIFVDTGMWGNLTPEQVEFVREKVNKNKSNSILLVLHYPFYQYSLITEDNIISGEIIEKFDEAGNIDVFEILRDANVKTICVGGHYHQNAIEAVIDGVTLCCTSALSRTDVDYNRAGYRTFTFFENGTFETEAKLAMEVLGEQ